MLSKNIFATSGAVAVVFSGAKWTILDNISMKTTMASFPLFVRGKLVMKSIDTHSHFFSGIGSGCNNLAFACSSGLMR